MKPIRYGFILVLVTFFLHSNLFEVKSLAHTLSYKSQEWEVTGTIHLTLNDVVSVWYTLAGFVDEQQYQNTASWQLYEDQMAQETFRLINLYALPTEEFDFEAPFFEIIFLLDLENLDPNQNTIVLEVNFSPTGDLADFYFDDYRTIALALDHITVIDEEILTVSGTLTGTLVHQDYKDFATDIEEYYEVKAEFNIKKIEYAITY